jgi:hypothetical protein
VPPKDINPPYAAGVGSQGLLQDVDLVVGCHVQDVVPDEWLLVVVFVGVGPA